MTRYDQADDPRLEAWLCEAAGGELVDIETPVASTRRVLLERVAGFDADAACPASSADATGSLRHGVSQFVARHRLATGGLATAALLMIVAALIAFNSPRQLSAMERTARELHAVTSYSYRLHWQSTWLEDDGKRKLTTRGDSETYWHAPDAFRNEMTIMKTDEDVGTGRRTEEKIEHFAEILPAGKRGLLIDYVRMTYQRIAFEPTGSKIYPWDVLRLIRDGSYDVQRDLGTKRIGDVTAHGYVLMLKNSRVKNSVPRSGGALGRCPHRSADRVQLPGRRPRGKVCRSGDRLPLEH